MIYFDIDTGYYPGVNHGLASLASAVRKSGHIFSFQHLTILENDDTVLSRVKEQSPDILGFSFTSTQRKFAFHYASKLKTLGLAQIAGGVHPTSAPEDVSSQGFFSGVAIGEAEFSLTELLNRFDRGEDLSTVPGFWWQGADGEWRRNPVPPLENDLSRLDMPDYSIFNTSGIGAASLGWAALMLTRGCPYNCSYCCNHVLRNIYPNRKDFVRLPPIDHAIRVIEHGLKFYPEVKSINFADDLLVFDQNWFNKFSRLYKREIGLPYKCNGRVEHISDTVVADLKESGCVRIDLGIESGSEWLRRTVLNRNPSNDHIVECFTRLKKAGIPTFSYNIVGFPFETKKHMEETLKLNRVAKPDMGGIFYFYPFRGPSC